MTRQFAQHLQGLQWTVRYQFAALSQPAKMLLLACVVLQVLMAVGVITFMQQSASLERRLEQGKANASLPRVSRQQDQQALIERFKQFLPAADKVEQVGAALNKAAIETGVVIDKLSSQPGSGASALFQRHALRLQLHGEREKIERFVLLSLLQTDALVVRRWAFQAAQSQTPASSTIDFELLVKAK